MKLTITAKHIDDALAKYKVDDPLSHCCPVALALRGAGYQDATVTTRSWRHGNRSHKLNKEARSFINLFDLWVSTASGGTASTSITPPPRPDPVVLDLNT